MELSSNKTTYKCGEKPGKKSARLILCFETPPRPCSTSASGQADGTTMGKLLSERHYRCLPSWAVMVTLSQQCSYCNSPAIWHLSFSMPLQKLNLPHNEFKIVVSVCFFCSIYNTADFSRKDEGMQNLSAQPVVSHATCSEQARHSQGGRKIWLGVLSETQNVAVWAFKQVWRDRLHCSICATCSCSLQVDEV